MIPFQFQKGCAGELKGCAHELNGCAGAPLSMSMSLTLVLSSVIRTNPR
jgi:hypothetical protein